MRPSDLRKTLLCAILLSAAQPGWCSTINNITGLPTYPNLDKAAMDDVFRTEGLGRWCARFTGSTSDTLSAVEDWYRRTLSRASETDLERDETFRLIPALTGAKFALGRDYVTVYRLPHRPTIIELHRCTWQR